MNVLHGECPQCGSCPGCMESELVFYKAALEHAQLTIEGLKKMGRAMAFDLEELRNPCIPSLLAWQVFDA